MSTELILVGVVVFFAILTQAISGSGLALIAMPLLVPVLGPLNAAALVSLIAVTTQLVMLARYHRALRVGGLWRLMLGSLAGIPIGVIALAQLDSRVILTVLGVLLVGYALYSLFAPPLPQIHNRNWGFGFGFVSGLLGGAYNTGGPPYVIYGVMQRWEAPAFKANLQVLLMVNSVTVVIAHLVAGHFTTPVLENYAIAFPMILAGAFTGFWLDRYIDEARFRKIVLVLLLIIGAKMLLS